MKVVLVSWHYFESQRRAGFHWLAEVLWKRGAEILFFTAPLSRFSRLRGDIRLRSRALQEANRIKPVRDRLDSFVWYTPWHPANLRLALLNRASVRLFRGYGAYPLGNAEEAIRSAETIIFESGAGLMLFDRFKSINPTARFVYRVSDDVGVVGCHPMIVTEEEKVAPRFDLVSVPSDYLMRRFRGLANAVLQPHGIEKSVFDEPRTSPYSPGKRLNAVSVGTMLFDGSFFRLAKDAAPGWNFHIIGAVPKEIRGENLIYHGELPFSDTVPYIQHADVGLAPYALVEGADYLAQTSNKLIQYTYCRLPIVTPHFASRGRSHAFGYQPGDRNSIQLALRAAAEYDRKSIETGDIMGWDQVVASLLE